MEILLSSILRKLRKDSFRWIPIWHLWKWEEIPHSSILRKLRIDSIGMTLSVRGLGGMRRGVLIHIFSSYWLSGKTPRLIPLLTKNDRVIPNEGPLRGTKWGISFPLLITLKTHPYNLYISAPARRKHPNPKSSKFGTLSYPTGWLSDGCFPVPWT